MSVAATGSRHPARGDRFSTVDLWPADDGNFLQNQNNGAGPVDQHSSFAIRAGNEPSQCFYNHIENAYYCHIESIKTLSETGVNPL